MSDPQADADFAAVFGDVTKLGGPADVIETHAARVFLCGSRAFKMKKPVDLGFLDFSSRQKRYAALKAELDLNRPAAPQLYRALTWIKRRGDGTLGLGGPGEAVEPVLEMARFDQDQLLDRLALAGQVDGPLARDLADAVFESHARARRAGGGDGGGGARRIRAVLRDAARRCRAQPGAPSRRLDHLAKGLDARLAASADLLDARARAGFVRRCHGDLHLNNIVRLAGRPVLFDALEFDEALATTDTLYDLAFVVMDLTHRGLGAAAAALVSQYAARLEGETAVRGLALLPAFCGVRALVRALVSYQRAGHGDVQAAEAYLTLAERCAAPPSAQIVGVGGLSGTGKSTLAEALAPGLGAPPGAMVIRADLERKVLEGVSWREDLPKSAYTREASRQVYDRQRDKARWAASASGSVIVDAVHSRADERAALEDVARASGAQFLGLWLEAESAVIRERVAARRADPSDADLEVVARQAGYDPGDIGWTRLNASKGAASVLNAARRAAGLV